MHSICSDGTDTPSRLVEMAAELGLPIISLTDHDTPEGVAEAQAVGAKLGVEVIPGCEISLENGERALHMLSYGFELGNPIIDSVLLEMRNARDERNAAMIELFNKHGIPLTLAELRAEAGDGLIGRPHFANVLIAKGVVSEREEAFERYLTPGAPTYLNRRCSTLPQAVERIRSSGAVPVVAHPSLIKFAPGQTIDSLLPELKEAGLWGLECWYSYHSDEQIEYYLGLARKYGLQPTGGSDHHGANRPDVVLGSGLGNLRVPIEAALAIKEATASRAA